MEKSQIRTTTKPKFDILVLLQRLTRPALFALAGYLFAICELPFGALPFGFALLCAADKNAVFVYLGLAVNCVLSIAENASVLLLGIYTAALLLRILVRLTLDFPFAKKTKHSLTEILNLLFCERLSYRLCVCAVCAFSFAAVSLIGGGFLYYDLFSLLLVSLLSPLAALVFYCFFEKNGVLRDVGFLALCVVSVYAAQDLKLYGVSLAVFGALFLTFFVSFRRGTLLGILTGTAVGLAYSPILSPIFIISALFSVVFKKISPTLACFASFFTSVAWGFYIKGIRALDGLFAGVLCACLLYSVFYKLYFADKTTKKETFEQCEHAKEEADTVSHCVVLDERELDAIKLFETNRRMSAMSDGLEALSSLFEEIKIRFPKKSELDRICREAFISSCVVCSECEKCAYSYRNDGQIEEMAHILERNRRLSFSDVDPKFCQSCQRLPDILDEINYNSGAKGIGADSAKDVFAPDCRALSRLLEKGMHNEENEYVIDEPLSERLCEVLNVCDLSSFQIEGGMAYGKRKKRVYVKGKSLETLKAGKEKIIEKISSAVDFTLDADKVHIFKISGGAALCVGEARRLEASIVSRSVRAKEEKEYCGDSLALFENRDGRFFSIISDGMGSGREAAAISKICVGFMKNMLDVGEMYEELLSMLNGFLSGRRDGSLYECSATVDLMELDLISGDTAFFKSGAAPSYVFRDGSLFKLRSCTMPIGILDETDTKKFNLKLSAGDVVVMMSDGITGGREECPWLFDLLRQNVESYGLERTADLIIKYAIGHGSRDDISLIIIKLEAA